MPNAANSARSTLAPIGTHAVILGFDDFEFDAERLELRRGGSPIKADARVLRLLGALVRNAGQLVTKQELVSQVWDGRAVSENVITVSMARLRRTLGQTDGREFVVNLHGRGYRFVRPVVERETRMKPILSTPQIEYGLPPFVGREPVLKRLGSALRETVGGRGGVCVLSGEPGIGKSRAVEMFEREAAAAGVLVAWGYCREIGTTPPLSPIAQLLGTLLERLPASEEARELRPALERLRAELSGAPDADGGGPNGYLPALRHRGMDRFTQLLGRLAESHPCLLVLEDLHRADGATLELLRYWIDEIVRTRVMLAVTVRKVELSEGTNHEQLAQLAGHPNATRIALERLREAEVRRYVAAVLGDPDGSLGQAVYVKSEGNPFFMTELSRQLQDSGAPNAEALAVPGAALDLVRQRVAKLDADARGVLSWAAVIGRTFELPLLQAVTGRELVSLMASLDDALATELVVAAPNSKTAFRFGHALLGSVLYDALAPGERRDRHLAVARALEQRRAAGDCVAPADLAHHLRSALPASEPRQVVDACMRAAASATAVFAYVDAGRYLLQAREALELLDRPSPRLRLKLLLGASLFARVCSLPSFEPLIAETIALAREQGAGEALARAGLMLDLSPGFPPLPGTRELLEDALAMLPEDDHGTRMSVLVRLGSVAPVAYDAEQSTRQLAVARELGKHCNAVLPHFSLLLAELYQRGGPAHASESANVMSSLETLLAPHRNLYTVPTAYVDFHRAVVALQDGNLAGMDAGLERCELRCREIGSRGLHWHTLRSCAIARIERGASAEGFASLRELHERAIRDRMLGMQGLLAFDEVVVFERAGEVPRETLRLGLAIDPGDPPCVWSLKTRALAAAGLHDDARRALSLVAAERLAALPCDRDYLGTLGALARAAVALGETTYAEALHALLTPYARKFAAHVSFKCEGSVYELLGLLELCLGRRTAALPHLDAALEASERAGLAVCVARVRRERAFLQGR